MVECDREPSIIGALLLPAMLVPPDGVLLLLCLWVELEVHASTSDKLGLLPSHELLLSLPRACGLFGVPQQPAGPRDQEFSSTQRN
ncbi:hypothetical protein BO94DRAFT_534335 [Aspergillus sclerotioniger CBS 115572]|uniref:Uncharacterized protein n=1 Tax=Aspergillus sclerotioniger CBS 115572 TaxID=1450535 RepID=A0A317WZA5_9EURO|nr:hypothetical protein BO94DRAFT_534335 [Aspergillus sclerotioniger CBS 115572]PWY89560.1 hypothetical protein BO94DRAFT_534335 [Aspergillus sclerotioniger CBS 115572]